MISRRSSGVGRSTKKSSSNLPRRSSSGGRRDTSFAVATTNTLERASCSQKRNCGSVGQCRKRILCPALRRVCIQACRLTLARWGRIDGARAGRRYRLDHALGAQRQRHTHSQHAKQSILGEHLHDSRVWGHVTLPAQQRRPPRGGHCTNGATEVARRGGNAMFLVSTGRSGFDGPAARTRNALRASIAARCRSSAMSAGSRAIRACRWCCRCRSGDALKSSIGPRGRRGCR